MSRKRRSNLAGGILLILLGAFFLALQLAPQLRDVIHLEFTWPLAIVGVGVFLLIFGLLAGAPGMAVPATIVAGIGGLLYYQNATGDWASWAYAWTLIPGFVGVGVFLSGLLGENPAENIRGGLWTMLISAILFLVFGSLLGGHDLLGPYWPLLLIGAGVLALAQALFRRRK